MREFMEVLRASEVFSGIEPDEIEAMLKCLDADTREYAPVSYTHLSRKRGGIGVSGNMCR